jgi:hypothetical protein
MPKRLWSKLFPSLILVMRSWRVCMCVLIQDSSAQKEGSGGHATEGKDSAGGKEKAKKEFPEAPDPAIGMQDERGGRGA